MEKFIGTERFKHLSLAGTETLAAMSATIINTTDISLNRFTPEERDCYLDNEFYFKNLLWAERFRYSIRNCFYEAVIAEIIEVSQPSHC